MEAFQIGGNHLKEADASACPCDVDLAKVASQQASAAQETKTPLRWLSSEKTGAAAAMKAVAGQVPHAPADEEVDDDARGDGGGAMEIHREIVSLEEGLAEVQTWEARVKELEGLLSAK